MKVLLSILLLLSVCTSVYADKITVTGRVTENGDGIPVVNITEKGTNNTVTTDMDGNYSITVERNAILVFSRIGYLGVEIPVNNLTTIDCELQPIELTLITMSIPIQDCCMQLPTLC